MNFNKLLDASSEILLVEHAQDMIKTYHIDISHGLQHCFSTMHYAGLILDYYLARSQKLIKRLSQDRAAYIIMVTAFIHDTMDDKYIMDDDKKQAEDKTESMLHELKYNLTEEEICIIFNIINNMSYSKRQKSRALG